MNHKTTKYVTIMKHMSQKTIQSLIGLNPGIISIKSLSFIFWKNPLMQLYVFFCMTSTYLHLLF